MSFKLDLIEFSVLPWSVFLKGRTECGIYWYTYIWYTFTKRQFQLKLLFYNITGNVIGGHFNGGAKQRLFVGILIDFINGATRNITGGIFTRCSFDAVLKLHSAGMCSMAAAPSRPNSVFR